MANSVEKIRAEANESTAAIRKDLRNLKDDAAELKDNLLNAGNEHLEGAKEEFQQRLNDAQKYIKQNPGQSVAIAFAAGALACLFLGRR